MPDYSFYQGSDIISFKIKQILEKYNFKIIYSPSNLLSSYLHDSLAFVQFMVDIEVAYSVKIPFGSFDLSLMDKSICNAEMFIQKIIEEKQND